MTICGTITSDETNRKPGRFVFSKAVTFTILKLWAKRPLCVDSRPACSSRQRRQAHKGRFVMSAIPYTYETCFICRRYTATRCHNGLPYCSRCIPIKKTCHLCKKEFRPNSDRNRFCSEECHKAYLDKKLVRNRFIIFDRDGFQCIYCGSTSYGDGVELTLDHIIPRSRGGSDCAENLVTACKGCNSAKNDRFIASASLIMLEVKRRNKWASINPRMTIKFSLADSEDSRDEDDDIEATQLEILIRR